MKIKASITVLLLLAALSSACAYKGGNKEYVHPPTLGAELADLKKAYDRGAIEEHEYHSKREDLLTAGELQNRAY